MAQTTSNTLQTVDDLDVVFDADSHTMEGFEEICEYVENDAYKRIFSKTNRPFADIFSFTHSGPISGNHYNRGAVADSKNQWDLTVKKRELDDFNIDYSLLTPTAFSNIMTVNNERHAVALATAYNAWLADKVGDETGRFKRVLTIAPQKPHKAAEEIDKWANEENVVGVLAAPREGISIGNEFFDPIYQAAQDNELTIVSHIALPPELRRVFIAKAQTFSESHLFLPIGTMWTLNALLHGGVPERFPELNFVIQEGGVGWIPFMRMRLDDHYLEYPDDWYQLSKPPTEYIDEQFYFTTQPLGNPGNNPEYISQLIEMAGPENMMYSADLPHMDFDPPEELFEKINPYLDEDKVRGIMGENATEAFDV